MENEKSAHNACLVKRILVCVYDKRARMWGDVISCPNEDVAARLVETMVGRAGTLFHDYPNDYALYKIGSTSEFDGSIEVSGSPTTLLYEFSSFVGEDHE